MQLVSMTWELIKTAEAGSVRLLISSPDDVENNDAFMKTAK